MEPTSEREQHLFVVRIWREDKAAAWRSTIVDLGSGQRLSSTELTDVGDFIRLRLPEPGASRSAAGSPEFAGSPEGEGSEATATLEG